MLIGASPPHAASESPRQKRATLDDLPTEVLEQILLLACTDGGYTGCSLSAVSHRIRAVSRTFRFHSISLLSGSPDRLRLFLECFREARSFARTAGRASVKADRRARMEGTVIPRLRHLCLATTQCPPTTVAPRRTDSLQEMADRHYWYAVRLIGEDFKVFIGATDHYRSMVQELLQLTCDDLETLCVYGPEEWGPTNRAMLTFSVPRGFAKLREMSVVGFEPQFPPISACRRLFPALTRLHIVAETSRPKPVDFRRWVGEAPKLETLRVTGDSCFARPNWIESLQCVISESTTMQNTAHALTVNLPAAIGETKRNPSLRILLLLKPIPMSRLTGITARYHAVASALGKQFQQAPLPVAFVPYYTFEDVNPDFAIRPGGMEEHVRRDWLARIVGDAGVFLDDSWWTPREDSLGRRFQMWWHYGKLYLPPTVRGHLHGLT